MLSAAVGSRGSNETSSEVAGTGCTLSAARGSGSAEHEGQEGAGGGLAAVHSTSRES